MKTACSSALSSYLDWLCTRELGGEYCMIDCYTVALANGTTLRWAAWALPITFPSTGIYAPAAVNSAGLAMPGNARMGGHTFSAVQAYLDRSKLVQALKLEVSQIKMTIRANPTMQIGSTPVLAAIASGMFSGAFVWVDRLFAQNVVAGRSWTDWQGNPQVGFDFSLGTLNWFTGSIAEVEDLGRAHAVLSAKDPTALLGDPYPRNLYLTGCRHSFGDAGCGYNKASTSTSPNGGMPATASGTVESGSTTVTINTNLTQPGPLPAPTTAPAYNLLTGQTNINLPAQTYYAVITFIGAAGESAPGPELAIPVTGGGQNGTTATLLQILAPTSPPAGAVGWNLYVGLASGDEQLQASFSGFTGVNASWTQEQTLGQGAAPPALGTLGYFASGVITFTSGVNNGISRVVTSYSNPSGTAGVVVVTPPLPVAPAAGDQFAIVADCDRSLATCTYRYHNSQLYAGLPWLPPPEMSV